MSLAEVVMEVVVGELEVMAGVWGALNREMSRPGFGKHSQHIRAIYVHLYRNYRSHFAKICKNGEDELLAFDRLISAPIAPSEL